MDKTTVTISHDTAKKIERLSNESGVSKREFMEKAMEYFTKNGINPIDHESPVSEILKLIKRQDQIIAFLKKQEKDTILPVYSSLDKMSQSMTEAVPKLATAKSLNNMVDVFNSNVGVSNNFRKNTSNKLAALDEKVLKLGEANKRSMAMLANMLGLIGQELDPKGRHGLVEDLKKAYNER